MTDRHVKSGCLVVVAVLVVAVCVAAVRQQKAEFSEKCRKRGGIPETVQYQCICFAPGTVLDVR